MIFFNIICNYKTEKGLLFPISLQEAQAGNSTFLAEDKAIYFIRWIRKWIKTDKEEEKNENSNYRTSDGEDCSV
jgi:hypothetical protein